MKGWIRTPCRKILGTPLSNIIPCSSSIQMHITGPAVEHVNSGPWLSTCAEQAV